MRLLRSRSCALQQGGKPLYIGRIFRRPPQHPLRLAVRDAAVLHVEPARHFGEVRFLQRLQRRRLQPEQAAGVFGHFIAAARKVIAKVIGSS